MSLEKKLSAKTIVGKIPTPAENEKLRLFAIFGTANDVETGETTFGPYVGFKGEFEAINYATGEHFSAPRAFIPEPAQGMIAASLQDVDNDGVRQNQSVDFALEIGVKGILFAGSATYEYTVAPLQEMKQSDRLAGLREQAEKALQALPAPTDDAKMKKPKPARKQGKAK